MKTVYVILILVLAAMAGILFALRNFVWLPDLFFESPPDVVGSVSTPEGDFYVVQGLGSDFYDSMLIWDVEPRVVYQVSFEDTKWWPSQCQMEYVDGEVRVLREGAVVAVYDIEEDVFRTLLRGKMSELYRVENRLPRREYFEMEMRVVE